MGRPFRKLFLSVAISGCVLFSAPAGAQFAVVDFAALVQRVMGNIQQAAQWAEEKMRLKASMDMSSILTGMQTDNTNNGFANVIARIGQQQQGLHDSELAEREAPDKDACEIISVNEAYQKGVKAAAAAKTSARKSFAAKNGNFKSTPAQQITERSLAAKKVVDDCPIAEDGTSPCLATEALMGAGDASSYSNDAAKQAAVAKQVDLIVGPVPDFKSDPARLGTDAAYLAKSGEIRRALLKNMVHTSLTEIAAMRAGAPSQLESMKSFALDRFGGSGADNWIKLATNTDPNKYAGAEYTVSPSELQRKMAIMDAFLTNLAVLQYEQSLRHEGLTAGILSTMVEPLK